MGRALTSPLQQASASVKFTDAGAALCRLSHLTDRAQNCEKGVDTFGSGVEQQWQQQRAAQ